MSSQKPTILIVDDINMNVRIADLVLRTKLHYQTLYANSGKDCLSILKKQQVHLVLLDIDMPDLNGIDTLSEIRKNPELRNLPVIFLTGSSDPLDIIKANELQVADYIRKPFTPNDLAIRVRKALVLQRQKNLLP